MFNKFFIFTFSMGLNLATAAEVSIDEAKFGDLLGGWKKRGEKAAEYSISGSEYRTYRPEITPNPDGGIFVSLRIDHMRGWLSTDDYAVLEITVNPQGKIVAARSSMAIQGRSISSDLIRSGAQVGKIVVGSDRAVQIGSDLVADISQKLLREKIVEAGRVSFPSALRHNYNLLYQSIELRAIEKKAEEAQVVQKAMETDKKASVEKIEENQRVEVKAKEAKAPEVKKEEKLTDEAKALEINAYAPAEALALPVEAAE